MSIDKIYSTLEDAKRRIADIDTGEMVYIEKEQAIYCLVDGELKLIDSGNINIQMTQYELNKQIYSQMNPKTPEEIEELKKVINNNIFYEIDEDDYFRTMLLCREKNYYTIFEQVDFKPIEFEKYADAVVECAQDLGEILDIVAATGAVEIWLKLSDNEVVVAYLFGCEGMFVNYRGI